MMTTAIATALGVLAGIILKSAFDGIGWLAKRRITKGAAHERVALYQSLADLRSTMQAAGASLEDIMSLEQSLAGNTTTSKATVEALVGADNQADRQYPSHYWASALVRGRASLRLEVLDAEIAELIQRFEGYWDDERFAVLNQAHKAWEAYRATEADLAGGEFIGGTHAPLAGTIAMIGMSEEYVRRLQDLWSSGSVSV